MWNRVGLCGIMSSRVSMGIKRENGGVYGVSVESCQDGLGYYGQGDTFRGGQW